ncbi:hypothetical protein GCM10009777_31090 [Microbacterium pumilum]|uniref:PE-PGRS family protein n=1 Tax=Microbacterium pumilum TaxID=344165 RepID=A0ABN2SW54_9MICO
MKFGGCGNGPDAGATGVGVERAPAGAADIGGAGGATQCGADCGGDPAGSGGIGGTGGAGSAG